MKGRLPIDISAVPCEEVERLLPQLLDTLADALADQCIAQARLEVAERLGIDEKQLGGRLNRINLSDMMELL